MEAFLSQSDWLSINFYRDILSTEHIKSREERIGRGEERRGREVEASFIIIIIKGFLKWILGGDPSINDVLPPKKSDGNSSQEY